MPQNNVLSVVIIFQSEMHTDMAYGPGIFVLRSYQ